MTGSIMTDKSDGTFTAESYAKQIEHPIIARRKQRLKSISAFLLQKKTKWESDTNQLLRQKKLDNPEELWSFFKRLSREPNKIPIEKSKLYDHFKYLNNALEAAQVNEYE